MCSVSADAVVNSANEELQHLGGLSLALLRAAGPQLQKTSDDYIAKNGRLSIGAAIVTDAGDLPCKYIVHTVGPRFSDFDQSTAVKHLKQAVQESLRQAKRVECSSIALPAISSGVFGFPVDLCADTIAEAVREYCDDPQGVGLLTEIQLVDNNDNTIKALASAVNKVFSDFEPIMMEPLQEEEDSSSEMMELTTAEGLKIRLCRGNIQDQTTDVIVNTIGDNMNLNQGAVSKALLQAAGPNLQSAVNSEAKAPVLQHGDVVITKGFELSCQKVFHSVCPAWDNGEGAAEEVLIRIIRFCLEQAEKFELASLSIPAIGTGNLHFPRDLVSRVLLNEIHSYSHRRTPFHLREVLIVVHPSDSPTVDCFSREFKRQAVKRKIRRKSARKSNLFSGLSSFFAGLRGRLSNTADPALERKDSDCAVLDMCADNEKNLSQAKRRITDLICD
ncbi:protein mono-ADP-ribosyltransferase PARP14-like [Anabas testudineus]|uniref:protein mono-ADP-ribosyltransferase PARP14-like n=1 Tax=Anabas testudineus TaxID=64144 RepID=UPI000E453A14|nr:protein mono-ADP-ribosyltransferase PARP14-like [Anabas testudineus]